MHIAINGLINTLWPYRGSIWFRAVSISLSIYLKNRIHEKLLFHSCNWKWKEINHSRLAWVKDFIDIQTNTRWSVLQLTSVLHDWIRWIAILPTEVIVYFFEMLGPGEIRHHLNILKRQQCPFVDIGILKVLVRWMKQSCAINVLISNLKLSLIHFFFINWCLNGCFIPFRNKTMHCIVSSWLMCLIQYSLNFEGFD